MKKLFPLYFPFLVLTVAFIFAACGKSEVSESSPFFTWTVNATPFSAQNSSYAKKLTASPTTVIYGKMDTNSLIQFSLMYCDTVGTYIAKMITTEPNSAYVFVASGGTEYDSDNCETGEQVIVNVTSLTPSAIKGNFTGSLRSSAASLISITGSFDLTFR